MPGDDATLIARVPASVDKRLSEIAEEQKKSKSEIIREAVIAYIGMYTHARKV